MANIVIISLERASERRQLMINQINRLNLENVHILDGVDGQNIPNNEIPKLSLKGGWRYNKDFQPGEIGCIRSHIKAIELAKENGWDKVIIFEDDITISEDFEKRVNLLFKMVPKNWEHIYLSGTPHFNGHFFHTFLQVVSSVRTDCLHSYVVNHTAYDKIINKMETLITTADDMIIDMIFREKNLKSYTYFPFVTHANSSYSYIWNKAAGHNIKNESKNYFINKL